MTKHHLDHVDIDAILQRVGCETVAQRMRADALGETRCLGGLLDDSAQLAGADRPDRVLAGK
jgi:hypothetical protein